MTQRESNSGAWQRVRGIASAVFPTGARLLHEWTLLVLMVVLFGGVGALLWQMSATSSNFAEAAALQDAARTSESLANFRALYTSEVVDRVRSHGIKVTHDYKAQEGSIPLPATLSIKLGELIAQEYPGSKARLYSDHPFPWREDGGPHDTFETEALVELRQTPDQPFVRVEDYQGRRSLRYATADRMQASCVACHNSHPDSPKKDWKVGDVRGVLEVVRPLEGFVAQTNAQLRSGFVLFVTLAAFGFATLVFFVVSVRRSLETIKETGLNPLVQTFGEGDCELGASTSRGKLLLLSAITAGTIFAFDLSIPLGVAACVPYILLVLLSMRSNRESDVVVAAAVGTALTILGFVLSPAGASGDLWKVLANRFLAIFAVWVTAILCLWQQRKTSEQARLVAEKTAAQNESKLVTETLGKLEKSEARIRAVVNSAADGIITIDEKGTIQTFNQAAEAIFGYLKTEVVGKNVSSLMPSPYREEHDTYLQRYLDTGVRAILDKRREVIGCRKDGTTFPMDLTASEAMVGDYRLFTGIVRDITDRKNTEENLRRFRAAIDTSADGIFLIDRESMRFVDASKSACDSVGYTHDELLAMGPHDIKPEFTRDQMAERFEKLVQERATCGVMETVHQRKDGSSFPAEIMLRFLERDGQQIIIEVARDITERKWAEEELWRSRHEIEEANTHLAESVRDLETFNTLAVGRELRMIDLKEEVNALLTERDGTPKYEIVRDEVTA